MPIESITRPRPAATPARSRSPRMLGPPIGSTVIESRWRPSARATTTAASSKASPVASKTVARPKTARTPPSAGPTMSPAMSAPASQPYAIPRSPSGTRAATTARDPGRNAAAPRPWTNRSAISQPIDRGSAKAAIARLATTRPPIIKGARPNRSESRPAGYWPMNCATRLAPTMMPTNAYELPRSRRNSGRMGNTDPTPVPTRKTRAMIPQSARRRAVLVAGTIGAGFDLHQPVGVEEAAHADQRGDRLDGAKGFAVPPAHLAPAARQGGEDPRTGHIVEASPHAGKSLADDSQALPALLVDVALAARRAVGGGRRAAGDLDRRTDPDRTRVADDGLPLTAGGENTTWRHGDHAR